MHSRLSACLLYARISVMLTPMILMLMLMLMFIGDAMTWTKTPITVAASYYMLYVLWVLIVYFFGSYPEWMKERLKTKLRSQPVRIALTHCCGCIAAKQCCTSCMHCCT